MKGQIIVTVLGDESGEMGVAMEVRRLSFTDIVSALEIAKHQIIDDVVDEKISISKTK